MWKWVGGCLLLIVFCVLAASWWGYQKMQSTLSPDGIDRVTIAGSPARVFATLANGDSVQRWMGQGNQVFASRRGPLVVGDSVRIAVRSGFGPASRPMIWQVTQIVPDRVLALRLMSDTSHRVVAIRHDSLTAIGDSTTIVSTLVSPLMDSLKNAHSQGKPKTDRGIIDVTSNLMLAALRTQSKLDLLQLKAHIENRPMPQRR
jgi:uncharacterized protein YndB with AHSA1/START domain